MSGIPTYRGRAQLGALCQPLALHGASWYPLPGSRELVGPCWNPSARHVIMMPDSDEILTIREVASLLKIGAKTAYTMVQSGELPGFKVRGQWRFRRSDIRAWIESRIEGNEAPPSAPEISDAASLLDRASTEGLKHGPQRS